ncbi:MAG TPA: hypothetical protein VF657_22030 [Actinoplanes sp.]|jgi:hypothetical protein
MSDTQQSTTGTPRQAPHAADVPYTAPSRSEPTAWAGLVLFGGIMIVMVGGFQCIQGFVALFRDDYYLVSRTGLVVEVDYTTWGWTHLIIGLVAVATGIGVLLGQMWARVLGIVVAVVSALVNVAFLAAYPVWSTIVIALDVLVIYAFAVHGREIRDA